MVAPTGFKLKFEHTAKPPIYLAVSVFEAGKNKNEKIPFTEEEFWYIIKVEIYV